MVNTDTSFFVSDKCAFCFHTANIQHPEGDVNSLPQLFFKKVKISSALLYNKVYPCRCSVHLFLKRG